MTIAAAHAPGFVSSTSSEREWATLNSEAPALVNTMGRYLTQLATFLAPRSVEVEATILALDSTTGRRRRRAEEPRTLPSMNAQLASLLERVEEADAAPTAATVSPVAT